MHLFFNLNNFQIIQFFSGKVALAFQLFSLGYTEDPLIPLNFEVCRVLEELYDEHGDTLAWQYAGSQLVHSIKTYKKTAAFQVILRQFFAIATKMVLFGTNFCFTFSVKNVIFCCFQERSRDVLQTLSRYYSNTFSDYEKQDGINLFLGVFRLVISQSKDCFLYNDRF